jgi:hypothetical protein
MYEPLMNYEPMIDDSIANCNAVMEIFTSDLFYSESRKLISLLPSISRSSMSSVLECGRILLVLAHNKKDAPLVVKPLSFTRRYLNLFGMLC